MTAIFIDTGAFVALKRTGEREHASALETLRALTQRGVRLVASNYIFAETYAALLARTGRWMAFQWGADMRAGTGIDFIQVDAEIEDAAWAILECHSDKDWSYVDAVSFALMEREGIKTAFAFDQHFTQRGLAVIPA
ncbi:MAG: type II toxin-antitoxin system VapC family toxin [Solirubrobacteraceae bacterium]